MRPTRKQPLFIVTGASCVGKSTACEVLFGREQDYIVLESDLLWRDFYNTPEDNYREYRKTWLNVCAGVSQIDLPCVLCGCATPEQFEPLEERGLFSGIHYLAVVCTEEKLLERARSGRGVTDKGWLDSSLHFNRWLREHAENTRPAIRLLDNTDLSAEQTAEKIDAWIRDMLQKQKSMVD